MECLRTLLLLLSFLASVPVASACPMVSGFPDFNCDGEFRVAVVGDSIVSGVGDSTHGNRGGYVLRTQAALPDSKVLNFGIPGLDTVQLLLNLNKAFSGRSYAALLEGLTRADLVVLDIGRNDFWSFGPPIQTLRRLRKARALIESGVAARAGHAPLVVTAVLLLPNRGTQGPWVQELNELIRSANGSSHPADLRFDKVSKTRLNEDRLHPTPAGFKAVAAVFLAYLRAAYPLHAAELRPDTDHDGLYDVYEGERYGTDPADSDTDDDGLLDGQDPSPAG